MTTKEILQATERGREVMQAANAVGAYAPGHEFHGNQWTNGNSETVNPKWAFRNAKKIGQVTDARASNWKRNPGDFTSAAQAAAFYAKRDNSAMQIVKGNSYGARAFHIHYAHEDGLGMSALTGDQHTLGIVHPTGEVYQVEAMKKK